VHRLHRAGAARQRNQRQRRELQEEARAGAVAAEDERGLEHRRVEGGRLQQVVRGTLGQVVAAGRAGIGAERGELQHAPHTLLLAGGEQARRRPHVQRLETLRASRAKDADHVDRRIDALQRGAPVGRRQCAAEIDAHAAALRMMRAFGHGVAHRAGEFDAGVLQRRGDMPADEAGGAGQEHAHLQSFLAAPAQGRLPPAGQSMFRRCSRGAERAFGSAP